MQTGAEAFQVWVLPYGIAGVVIVGLMLAAFGVVLAVASMRNRSADSFVADGVRCGKCGELVPSAKSRCPACGARAA
ncbi:MAG TPA: hypothetical protein VGN57_02575 [Pirellulaceae bacterium]|jgi:hypothetical protein|nr:hypothetical protein [Pirellulaceae bacterium]